MKRKWKRRVSLLAATVVAAGILLTGCGNSSSATETSGATSTGEETTISRKDMPVIQVVIASGANTDNTAEVQNAINDILAEKIGAQINITWLGWGSYANQMNLMLTSPKEADVVMLAGFSTTSLVNNGELLDITDYYESDPTPFTDWVDPVFIDSARVNGRVYTIPNDNNFSGEACVMVNRAMADEMGMDLSDTEKIWTLDEIHDLVAQAVATYPDIYGVVPQSGATMLSAYTWDNLGSNNIGVVEDHGHTGKVVSITDCEDYINFAKTMREWYQEGLIMQDCLSNTESWTALTSTGKAFCNFNNGGYPNTPETEDGKYYVLSIDQNWSSSASRMCYAIAGNTNYPDESFEVLKEMYNNADVANLLCWGIEGTNYVLDDQGRAANPDGVTTETNTYSNGFVNPWALPNMQIAYGSYTVVPNYYELLREYDENAEKSSCLGCIFDSTSVTDEYTACTNVIDKYYNAIMSGSVDVDETLETFKKELAAAGEAVVIAEKQKQLDDFLTGN